jgi:putative flippase GtrA
MRHFVLGRAQTIHIQFLRYFFVGGTAAVVDLFFFTLCITYFNSHYAFAAFVGYMLGLSWNYIISLFWVFESRHRRSLEMLMVFFIAIGGLLWTWLILYLLIEFVGLDDVFAKMISQILVLFWNFGMRKFYVFH